MRVLVKAYAASTMLSLIGLMAVTSSLAANHRVLSGMTSVTLGLFFSAAVAIFLLLCRNSDIGKLGRILHALVATFLIPTVIAFAPLLYCIFIGHGQCS